MTAAVIGVIIWKPVNKVWKNGFSSNWQEILYHEKHTSNSMEQCGNKLVWSHFLPYHPVLLLPPSVCLPLRLLLIKLLLLTTALMGQLQAVVKSDRSLSHTVTKRTSIFDNMTQGTDHHCCVCTWPMQKSSKKTACMNNQRSDRLRCYQRHLLQYYNWKFKILTHKLKVPKRPSFCHVEEQ